MSHVRSHANKLIVINNTEHATRSGPHMNTLNDPQSNKTHQSTRPDQHEDQDELEHHQHTCKPR